MAAGDFGYGWFTLWDTSHQTNTLVAMIKAVLAGAATMELVEVAAVHAGEGSPPLAGTVDVLPLVNQVDGRGNAVEHGTVYGIPFLRLQGGTSGVIADPAAGDIGLMICADRDSSNVVSTGAQANPGSFRAFDRADGVYVGAVLAQTISQYLWFSAEGVTLLDANGNSIAGTSTGLELTPASGEPVTVDGPLVVTGEVTFDHDLHVEGNLQVDGNGVVDGTLQVDAALSALSLGLTAGGKITRIITASFSTSGTVPIASSTPIVLSVAGVKPGDVAVLNFTTYSGGQFVVTTDTGTNTVTLLVTNAINTANTNYVIAGNLLVLGTT